jgi:hypothetical protein
MARLRWPDSLPGAGPGQPARPSSRRGVASGTVCLRRDHSQLRGCPALEPGDVLAGIDRTAALGTVCMERGTGADRLARHADVASSGRAACWRKARQSPMASDPPRPCSEPAFDRWHRRDPYLAASGVGKPVAIAASSNPNLATLKSEIAVLKIFVTLRNLSIWKYS